MNNDYSAHPWVIDVEVHFANGWTPCTDLTDVELDMYLEAIKATLEGDFFIGIQDNMIEFWADNADEEKLDALLGELEEHGCWFDYPDWYGENGIDYPEWHPLSKI